MNRVLITGAAGFIEFHLSKSFVEDEYEVFGLDNINDYYGPQLKQDRLDWLKPFSNIFFKKIDMTNYNNLDFINI